MPHDRFYYPGSLKQKQLLLEGEELHHLVRVMRQRVGEFVELVNGKGELAEAEITSLSSSSATLTCHSHFQEKPIQHPLILAQALTRPSHLDWIIEKGTELGAHAFWLFPGEKSEKSSLSSQQEKRLHQLSLAALKQCGRLFLPDIIQKPPLLEWTACPGTLLFGSLSKEAALLSSPSAYPAIFCVGPEKGFSAEEEAHLTHVLNGQAVKLHTHTLRTETAGLVALSQLFYIQQL